MGCWQVVDHETIHAGALERCGLDRQPQKGSRPAQFSDDGRLLLGHDGADGGFCRGSSWPGSPTAGWSSAARHTGKRPTGGPGRSRPMGTRSCSHANVSEPRHPADRNDLARCTLELQCTRVSGPGASRGRRHHSAVVRSSGSRSRLRLETDPLLAQAVSQPGDVGGLALDAARRLHDDRRARGSDDVGEVGAVDVAGAEVGVPVGAGVELVAAVVAVDEVDATGDRPDLLDDAAEVVPAGVGVAGVEAEADGVAALGRGRSPPTAARSPRAAVPWRCRRRRCSRSAAARASRGRRCTCASCRTRPWRPRPCRGARRGRRRPSPRSRQRP